MYDTLAYFRQVFVLLSERVVLGLVWRGTPVQDLALQVEKLLGVKFYL